MQHENHSESPLPYAHAHASTSATRPKLTTTRSPSMATSFPHSAHESATREEEEERQELARPDKTRGVVKTARVTSAFPLPRALRFSHSASVSASCGGCPADGYLCLRTCILAYCLLTCLLVLLTSLALPTGLGLAIGGGARAHEEGERWGGWRWLAGMPGVTY
jgi:hypothetical protein